MCHIKEENKMIIEEIDKLIHDMNIEEMEQKFIDAINDMNSENKIENRVCDVSVVYRYMEKSGVYLNRIIAVNEKIITKNELLSNRIQQIRYMQSIPCNISLMDMPLNRTIYSVQLYYNKLYQNYITNPATYLLAGLMCNINGRELKVDTLSENEKFVAEDLNGLIACKKIQNIFNSLIDLCKNIIFNYCGATVVKEENE